MYKAYEVRYVRSLQRWLAFWACCSGVLVGLGLASFFLQKDEPVFKGLEGFSRNKEVSVAALTQAKVDAQVRLMIAKANPRLRYTEVARIAELEKKWAAHYKVPLHLGLAITMQESTFQPNAKSPTGPVGLKQIATSYWAAECSTTAKGLQDPAKNIECGYYILAKLYKQEGSWDKVLKRYYGGTAEENEKYRLTVRKKAAKMADITT